MGETMGSLSVSRRDVLKVSALGAAALALPFERVARAKTASKIAESKIPRPYTLPFKVPPVIDGRGGGTLTIAQKMANAAYMGLAAMYLMSDELEDRLPIPKGSYDLPMVIADKMFAANGSLMYDDEGHSG